MSSTLLQIKKNKTTNQIKRIRVKFVKFKLFFNLSSKSTKLIGLIQTNKKKQNQKTTV